PSVTPSQIPTSAGSFSLCLPNASSPTGFECPVKNHKDIFVEIDYMQGHQPIAQGLTDVKTSFANSGLTNPDGSPGIKLHIQVDEQITRVAALNVWKDTDADSTNDFFKIKQNKFGTSTEHGATLLANNVKLRDGKAQAFHYALFANSIGACGPSGIAELPGNDLIVSLGCGFNGVSDGFGGVQGTQKEQEGTLMHELGHNLSLDHGGPIKYRVLPSGYSNSGTPALALTDGASGDTSRKIEISGVSAVTAASSTGSTLMSINLPFS